MGSHMYVKCLTVLYCCLPVACNIVLYHRSLLYFLTKCNHIFMQGHYLELCDMVLYCVKSSVREGESNAIIKPQTNITFSSAVRVSVNCGKKMQISSLDAVRLSMHCLYWLSVSICTYKLHTQYVSVGRCFDEKLLNKQNHTRRVSRSQQ